MNNIWIDILEIAGNKILKRLNKITKIAIFTIGLSTLISGTSIFATENNIENNNNQKIDTQNSDKTSNPDIGLINNRKMEENQVEERMKIFDQEIANKEEPEYADYYSTLVVIRRKEPILARLQTKIYMHERENFKSKIFADYYSSLKVNKLIGKQEIDKKTEDLMVREAELYERILSEEQDEILAKSCASLIAKFGMDDFLAKDVRDLFKKEANLKVNGTYIEYFIELIVVRRIKEELARKQAGLYEFLINSGKSYDYSDYYSTLVNRDKLLDGDLIDKMATTYELKRLEGISNCCADYYTKLVFIEKISEDKAEEISNVYEKILNESRSEDYANYYAKLIVDKKFDEEKSRLLAEGYEQKAREKKEYNYLKYCDFLDEYGNEKEKARVKIYRDKINKGKSHEYAEYYSHLVMNRETNDEWTEVQADLYEKEIKSGRSHEYADCYVTLVLRKNMNETLARIQAERFEEKEFEKAGLYLRMPCPKRQNLDF